MVVRSCTISLERRRDHKEQDGLPLTIVNTTCSSESALLDPVSIIVGLSINRQHNYIAEYT